MGVEQADSRAGIAELVERHCRLSRLFAERLGEVTGITIMNEVVLNQTIMRFGDDDDIEAGDDLTRRVIERLQEDGTCFFGGASWKGKWVMRISVIGWTTAEEDMWYRKAADHRNVSAGYNLGLMYEYGAGVTQDDVVAHVWFDLAAAQGDKYAKSSIPPRHPSHRLPHPQCGWHVWCGPKVRTDFE